MSDTEDINEDEQRLEKDIDKEINKLKYFLEETDELIHIGDYTEMEIAGKRAEKIIAKLSDLVSQTEELKIDRGVSSRSVRHWKKDVRSKYAALVEDKEKLARSLRNKQDELNEESERRKEDLKREQQREEERRLTELRERQQEYERQCLQEKLEAELDMAKRKLEMEKNARSTSAKLPKLKITPFKGTPTDWVRFENMFVTQVHDKPISEEEKFGYLLEMVSPKVREKVANLKPGPMGYKIAWERLKKEYGQTKLVVNAHMEEIINLPVVRGSNYAKIQEFYEKVSKNYDALLTMGEADMLRGFVISTLNKLPHVKPDLVRTDDDWEDWDMEAFISGLQKWLKRNKAEDRSEISGDTHKKERHWFTPEGKSPKTGERGAPVCVYCQKDDHRADSCKTYETLEQRRKYFAEKSAVLQLCESWTHREKVPKSRLF